MPQMRKYTDQAKRQAAYRKRVEHARKAQLTAKGLPALPAIPTIPGTARWNAAMRLAEHVLTMVVDEMQEYYDDRSEEWQEGERGDEHQRRLDAAQETLDAVAQLTT